MIFTMGNKGERLCNAAECSSMMAHLETARSMDPSVDLAVKLDSYNRSDISIKQACLYV